MKTITGEDAYKLLMEAEALILQDGKGALMYGTPDIENDGEYSLTLEYWDDGLGYEYTFYWTENDTITIDNNRLYLKEGEDEEPIGINVLQIRPL